MALSVTILAVTSTSCVVWSAYVIVIFPPVKSKLSPCSYVVFVGGVTTIPVIPFTTLILNEVVFPSYVTCTVFVPPAPVKSLSGVKVTPLSVKLTVSVFPAFLVTIIVPLVKS